MGSNIGGHGVVVARRSDGDGGSAVTTREDGARTLGLFLGELGLFGRREGVGGVWGGHVRLAVL